MQPHIQTSAIYITYRRAYTFGLAAYLLMLVLAVVFYKERTIFVDSSFLLFKIAKTGSFFINVTRAGAAITEAFPVLAFKMGVPLKGVLMSYSVVFIIYYLACYVVCGAVLKRYDFGLVILLLNVLFATDSFYWIVSELPQGIAMMITCFALLKSGYIPAKKSGVVALVVGITSVAFFHPLVIFPLYYTVAFLLLREKGSTARKWLYGSGLYFLPVMAIKSCFLTAHDMGTIAGAGNLFKIFPHYAELPSTQRFLHLCRTQYYWAPLLAIAAMVVYVWQRKWWQLLLLLCSLYGYTALVNATFPNTDTTIFYMENMYIPLAVFIGLPFVFDVLPVLQVRKVALITVILIITLGIVRIYNGRWPYVTRLNWERRFLDVNQDKKLAVYEPFAPLDTLIMTWATPYEFWLLSTTERHKTASIIVITNIKQYDWAFNQTKSLIVMGDVCPYATLPKRYFTFTDTVTDYTLIQK